MCTLLSNDVNVEFAKGDGCSVVLFVRADGTCEVWFRGQKELGGGVGGGGGVHEDGLFRGAASGIV